MNQNRMMTTQFVTVEIALQETPVQLLSCIEAELKKQGDPLRWAVTGVDILRQKASVEAVITCKSDSATLK